MNKKVSTIFAMAALMGGVFSGSAYAQTLEDPIAFPINPTALTEMGGTVILNQNGVSLGFTKAQNADYSTVAPISDVTAAQVEKTEANNYTWNVTTIAADDSRDYPVYTFVNAVTGDTLSFAKNAANPYLIIAGTDPDNDGDKDWAEEGWYRFSFGTTGAKYAGAAVLIAEATRNDASLVSRPLYVDLANQVLSSSATSAVSLHSMNTLGIEATVLNQLYNGRGFNLDAEKVSGITADVQGNLFNAGEVVWAFDVPTSGSGIEVLYDERGNEVARGYVISRNDRDQALIIPSGTYFFTNPVFNRSDINETNATLPSQINWLASTLIAVSPTSTGENTDASRASGVGFELQTYRGSDFLFITNTSVPQGDDIWITNACFSVESDYTDSYEYAISLPTFYYQESATAAGTTNQEVANNVYLGVTSYENSRQSIGTVLDRTHVFELEASTLVDGIDLLNTTRTPAVYTIKFVNGGDLANKYLTVGNDECDKDGNWQTPTGFRWEAKGMAIADTVYPIFQYVITAVDEDNYVTFTNRETGKTLKTQLFSEGEGTNRYTLSEVLEDVVPYTVNTHSANTYAVEQQEAVDADADVIIELTKLTSVDRYAGFLNVDNGEIRTLAFARDKNDTSNKLYTTIQNDGSASYPDYRLNYSDEYANDIADAAQWQLVKAGPATISRVFVYNNTTTQSIDDVVDGDKVSAYVYALQYVVDGEATNFYLKNNHSYGMSGMELEELSATDDPMDYSNLKFIIKENVDGSVSLIARNTAFDNAIVSGSNKVVAPFNGTKSIEVYNWNRIDQADYNFGSEYIYTSASSTNEVKTYLDAQPVDVSWPAKEGHVTLLSDLGNYITMNEDRDGIVVNEEVADTYYLYVTDKDAIVPSFYITRGTGATNGERMYMFNPTDSVKYYVATGDYDRVYQWNDDRTKVMFKAATINETRDTLTMDVKGETKYVAKEADDNNADIWGGINRFKWQIIEADDADGYYRIRQAGATVGAPNDEVTGPYLASWNDRLTWSNKEGALLFQIDEVAAPTANEGVSATEVKIIATDGAVNVKNAAGKNVVVSTILGQIVANEVLTSDNATISVPAGIAIVSVDGEEAVKVSVK